MNSTVSATSVTTSTDHDKHQELSPTYKVLLAVLIIQSVVTCVGNAMTIIVVYRDAALRTLGNIHVVSLAYADFIAGLTGLFDVIWFINKDVTTFFSYCKFCCLLWYILFFVSFAASLFSMSLIALDRWIFIAYPLRYYIWITPLKTTFLIGSAWTAAMLFGLLPAAINTFDTVGKCTTYSMITQEYLTYGVGTVLFGSCVISFAFYFKIFLIARKQKRCTQAQYGVQGDRRSSYRQIKILFLVCCITFVCWVPFYIENLPYMPTISREASNFVISLSLFNSCANFFLYSAKNAEFRKSFLKLLPGHNI